MEMRRVVGLVVGLCPVRERLLRDLGLGPEVQLR